MSDEGEVEPLPSGRLGVWVATLAPGSFALVMATGIVAVGSRLLGWSVLAEVLLWLAGIGFVVLLVAAIARAVRFPRRTLAALRAPSSGVQYFTVVAAAGVLGEGLLPHGLWPVSLGLGLLALLVWILLSYGLLCSIVLIGHRPQLREMTGIWLIWVVGTQSISVLAAGLSPWLPQAAILLDLLAVAFWSIGVVLYLILVAIIFLRLLTVETVPAEMGPAYWILMGATAISVAAASGILGLAGDAAVPLVEDVHDFVAGAAVVLWSFGSWFIPALVLFGLWRHLVRRHSMAYEPGLWSVVFPLGMYAVASVLLGRVLDLAFLRELAAVWIWLAVAAWLAVLTLMVAALVRGLGRRGAAPRA